MDRINFKNFKKLADYMIDKAYDCSYVAAVLYYNDAKNLVRELMSREDVDFDMIEMSNPDFAGYDREYYVSLSYDYYSSNEDCNRVIIASCERAYNGEKYLRAEADVTLVHSDAHSSILSTINDNKFREFCVGEDDFECEDCVCKSATDVADLIEGIFDNVRIYKDSNNNPIGIQLKWSFEDKDE